MRSIGLALVVLVGCSGNGKDTGSSADLSFTDENNYSYEPNFQFGEIEVQAGADATVDWTAMTTDIRGRPMDPASVQQLLFVEFLLSKEEVVDLILSNSIDQSDSNTQWVWDNTSQTSVNLNGNFNALGNLFNAATNLPEDPSATWIMTLVNLPNGAYDILSSKFVTPKTTSTNTTIEFTDDCTTIEVIADLHSAPALETQEGIGPYTLEWGGLTTDVNGVAWDPLIGDNLVIAHFDATDIAEVEAEFVRLDVAAAEYYQMNVFGTTEADLSQAQTADGTSFAGFTADGIWLVGLTCRTCISPLPLAVAVVEVSAP